MKNIRVFYLKIFSFLEINFSIYLNRRVFVMTSVKPVPYIGSVCSLAKYSPVHEDTNKTKSPTFVLFVCSCFPKATFKILILLHSRSRKHDYIILTPINPTFIL